MQSGTMQHGSLLLNERIDERIEPEGNPSRFSS